MQTLTIVIPSYNASAYLDRSMASLLPTADDVEIIIVDDGSTDDTAAIAHRYARQNPGVVSVISKPNGGHGSAINAGLAAANGAYLKVLDSDDWLDASALRALLQVLRRQRRNDQPLDLVVTNFVYEKQDKQHKHVMQYRSVLPTHGPVGWEDIGRFGRGQALLMHSLTYRTDVLRAAGLRLPEHTFYVDNLYAFAPLAHVRRLQYLDVDLYRYYIGREDQSVNERVMLGRVDQQLRVNRLMIEQLPKRDEVPDALFRYLTHYLGLVTAISSILLIRLGTPDDLELKHDIWQEIRRTDRRVHRRLRHSTVGQLLHLPGRSGRRVTVMAYRAARGVVGFN